MSTDQPPVTQDPDAPPVITVRQASSLRVALTVDQLASTAPFGPSMLVIKGVTTQGGTALAAVRRSARAPCRAQPRTPRASIPAEDEPELDTRTIHPC